jgi:LysM repeat protein
MPSPRLFLTTLLLLISCDVSPAREGFRPPLRVYPVGAETLSHVALKTGVSVAKLRSLNHLESDVINGGTGLLVPESEKTLGLPAWKPLLPAPEWKPCAQVEWVAVTPSGDGRCQCAGEACVCVPSAEDADQAELSFGQATWKSDAWPANAWFVFRHARVDLDGDGRPESVVSVREGVGNGLGVEWWKHMVVHEGVPVGSFVTIDHGESFVAQPQGCALLATSHEWRTDQLRGEGSYWLARLHVLRAGVMRAVGPEVARRYTYRFASQRGAGLETEPAHPLPWFTDVGAFTWPEPESRFTCQETSVVFEDDEARFDLGPLGLFEPRDLYREEPLALGTHQYDQLLDAATGAPLIDSYRLFGEARWSGRKVTLCEGTSNGEPRATIAIH